MVFRLVGDWRAVIDDDEVNAVQYFRGISGEGFEEVFNAPELVMIVTEEVRDVGEPDMGGGLDFGFHVF